MRPPLSDADHALLRELESRKPSELIPLFLELSRRQSERRQCSDLLAQLERDPFVFASTVDQRTSTRFDNAALTAADEFEAVLLSPLTPLGTCAVVSPTTQDRSVTTARTNEVVSDPTNVLALSCAQRLKAAPRATVRLCTVHQVVRPQRFPANKGWSQHFRLFAMAEAGAAAAEHRFEVDAVGRQLSAFLRLFDLCEAQLGSSLPNRRITLHIADRQAVQGERIEEHLAATHAAVPLRVERGFASGYYDGIRLLVDAESAKTGGWVQLADIGIFDWMGKLTSNRRMRFVASGLGIQLLPLLFAKAP